MVSPTDPESEREAFVDAFRRLEAVPQARTETCWKGIEDRVAKHNAGRWWIAVGLAIAAILVAAATMRLRAPLASFGVATGPGALVRGSEAARVDARGTASPIQDEEPHERVPDVEPSGNAEPVLSPDGPLDRRQDGERGENGTREVEERPRALESRASNQAFDVASARKVQAPLAVERGRKTRDGASALAEETRLFRAIRRDLARGEPVSALAKIEEHARRFPAGAFERERAVARVQALCASGRVAEAQRYTADALATGSHGGALASTLASACAPEVRG